MAYYLVGDDNKAPAEAKIGDKIVTGGGVYEKTATGGKFVEKLPTASGISTSYTELKNIYADKFGGWIGGKSSGGSSGSGGTTPDTPQPDAAPETVPTPETENVTFDANGLGYLGGFDMGSYPTYPTGNGSLKNFFGYILLGLIMLVVLERLVDK